MASDFDKLKPEEVDDLVDVGRLTEWLDGLGLGKADRGMRREYRLAESRGRSDWADRDAMVARWEAASGRTAPDLRDGLVLSAFKLSIMVESIYRRSKADPTRSQSTKLGEAALELMAEAREIARD
jgi:aminoglycoside phosphotransferase (APT) family kinase protein